MGERPSQVGANDAPVCFEPCVGLDFDGAVERLAPLVGAPSMYSLAFSRLRADIVLSERGQQVHHESSLQAQERLLLEPNPPPAAVSGMPSTIDPMQGSV
jgi:hypothetical protein